MHRSQGYNSVVKCLQWSTNTKELKWYRYREQHSYCIRTHRDTKCMFVHFASKKKQTLCIFCCLCLLWRMRSVMIEYSCFSWKQDCDSNKFFRSGSTYVLIANIFFLVSSVQSLFLWKEQQRWSLQIGEIYFSYCLNIEKLQQ